MRMMIPKNREISGTAVLYIVVVDLVGLTLRMSRALAATWHSTVGASAPFGG
jgi:hypothetical protein